MFIANRLALEKLRGDEMRSISSPGKTFQRKILSL
jgi:hypothetical protein